jgi:hypothetical protein
MISAAVSPYALAQKLGWFGERGVKMMWLLKNQGACGYNGLIDHGSVSNGRFGNYSDWLSFPLIGTG